MIGGIIGIGIVRRGREIRYKVLGDIALGWLVTPLLAGVITFFGLFILQNVFNQEVYRPASHSAAKLAILHLKKPGNLIEPETLRIIRGKPPAAG